jgi:hypothetical protein
MAKKQGKMKMKLVKKQGKKPSSLKGQLKKGTKMEAQEHKDVTKGKKAVAQKIAKAHLKEHANYYEELPKCEAKMKRKRRK